METSNLDTLNSSENSNSNSSDSNASENTSSLLKESPFGPLLQFLSEDELASILSGGGSGESPAGGNAASGDSPSGDISNLFAGGGNFSGGNPFAGGSNPFAGGGNTSGGDNTTSGTDTSGDGNTSGASNPFAGASNPFAGSGIPFANSGNTSVGNNRSIGNGNQFVGNSNQLASAINTSNNTSPSSNTSGGASNPFAGVANPFASSGNTTGDSNTSPSASNPFAGGGNLFAGGGNPFAGDGNSQGNEQTSGNSDLDKLFAQSPWGSLSEVGITSFAQVFGGIDGGNNPFTGGGNTSTDGTNSITGGESSSNGVYTWDFTGLDESNFQDPNNPFNKLLTILGVSKPSDSNNTGANSGDHAIAPDTTTDSSAHPVSGDDNQSANVMAQAQEAGFTFTNNPLAEFFGSNSCDSSDNSNFTFNGLPLPFDNPNWFASISHIASSEDSKFNATDNESIGNGNWYFASDNKTFGNGNWYFSDDNVTIGNGNWQYGTDNATIGNGNWNFGEDNATVGNGNWYLGKNNQTLGNGNWIEGNNNIVIGSPASNGKIFSGNNSLVIGNNDWAIVVDRCEISDELSHQVDELLNGGLKELQNSDGNVLTTTFIDSFYNQITDDFLKLLSSGGNLNQPMSTSGTGTSDSNALNSIINNNDSLSSLSGMQAHTNTSSNLASI